MVIHSIAVNHQSHTDMVDPHTLDTKLFDRVIGSSYARVTSPLVWTFFPLVSSAIDFYFDDFLEKLPI